MSRDVSRVLMTADAVGGVWTYALDLARGLATRGIEVTLATMGPEPTPAQQAAAAQVPALRLVTSTFALEWMDRPWVDVSRAGGWLLDLESRVAPDVVHLNGYAHGALPFTAPTVVVGHSCVLSWAEALPGSIGADTLTEYHARVQPGLAGADLVVTPSRTMGTALEKHYGVALDRLRVIYNARRSGVFAPTRKEPFVFTAGRLWDRAKNVDMVIEVAPRLPWPTAVAGAQSADATGRPTGRAGARMLGVVDEPTLAGWLGRASIFALPARYEPFGLLPLEAALSGCALVLGDIPSLREIWGDAAEYVSPDDPVALERTLSALIASPVRLGQKADAARRRAGRYSLDRMVQGYMSVYQEARTRCAPEGAVPCAS